MSVSGFSKWYLLGFGFYWAWMSVAFFSPVLASFAPDSFSADQTADLWMWYSWIALCVKLIHVILVNRVKTIIGNRVLFVLAPAFAVFGTGSIPLATLLFPSSGILLTVACVLGAVVAAMGTTWLDFMWGELYFRVNENDTFCYAAGSFILLAVLHFVITSASPAVAVILTIVLPVFSWVSLAAAKQDIADNAPKTSARAALKSSGICFSAQLILPLAAIFIYGCCGELLHYVTAFPDSPDAIDAMGAWYTLGGLAGTLLLLAAFACVKQEESRLRVVQVLFVVMAIGIVAPTLFGSSYYITYAIFGASFWCFRLIVWTISLRMSRQLSLSPILVLGVSHGMFNFAIAFSAPLRHAIAGPVRTGSLSWEAVAGIMVVCILSIAMFVFTSKGIRTFWGIVPDDESTLRTGFAQDVREEALSSDQIGAILAKCYSLSPREVEVALLLASGRSLPYIQDKLHIATGTAKTHMRHIYEKLGVHERQEFLDLVEGIKEQ